MHVEDSRKMTARENNENQQWKINYTAGRVVRSFDADRSGVFAIRGG